MHTIHILKAYFQISLILVYHTLIAVLLCFLGVQLNQAQAEGIPKTCAPKNLWRIPLFLSLFLSERRRLLPSLRCAKPFLSTISIALFPKVILAADILSNDSFDIKQTEFFLFSNTLEHFFTHICICQRANVHNLCSPS